MMNETQPQDISETQPNKAEDIRLDPLADTQPQSVPGVLQREKAARPSRAGFWISLLILILALGLGGATGYGKGVAERVDAQETQVSQQLGAQFALIQKDIDDGRYGVARQRLEFIIQQDANFPGAVDKLAEVMVKSAITPSPVPTETPTLTPTADLRGQEAIFNQAQQELEAKDWTALMGSLDSLRKADPAYKAVLVDGMYYTALRNRGMDQILGIGAYTTTNMEGGIYDLTLAEHFGPLDGYADGLRTFTRMYIIAASFWDVNWPQAVNYFRQVSQFAPNLRDASNVTANQRLYTALLKNGDLVSGSAKRNDRCVALELWDEARNISALNDEYSYKYNQLYLDCNPPTEVPTEVPIVVPIVIPTEVPIEVPTGEPTLDVNLTPTISP